MSRTNRLADALSPYLLQHKNNPVDWFPWGYEAFARARELDRPIFLSIGYATCHWCHVMERESFEHQEVADVLNASFVSIKVDREERPDIDALYMSVCQMMSGRCGWPLTVLMTPEAEPFFVATYLPRRGRFQQAGLMDLLEQVRTLWANDRARITSSAEEVREALEKATSASLGGEEVSGEVLRLGFEQLRQQFDERHGGFGTAPKFPSPHHLLFLLRYAAATEAHEARTMVTATLHAMRAGGLWDHLGGGFHRYSTDATWKLPHFEKMLYDQAMLLLAYAEGHRATHEPSLADAARAIAAYVKRDLTTDEGLFCSAEDADSEGEEGLFYLWAVEDVRALLGEEAPLFEAAYGLEPEGNYEDEATRRRTGLNVLHRVASDEALAESFGTSPEDVRERLATSRAVLFERRAERERPLLDDKVLTDWNGLMIGALARAAVVLDAAPLAAMAVRAADTLLERMRPEPGTLWHRYRAGQAGIGAHLDDYAYLTFGLLELYGCTFEPRYLAQAAELLEEQHRLFWDEAIGGYFMTAADAEPLLVRQKEYTDGALPSGNSVAMWNLVRMARLTGDTRWVEAGRQLTRSVSEVLRRSPAACTALLDGLDAALHPGREIVLAYPAERNDEAELLARVRERAAHNDVVLVRTPASMEALAQLAPFTEAQVPVDGRPTAYVCEAHVCRQPVTDPKALDELLAAS